MSVETPGNARNTMRGSGNPHAKMIWSHVIGKGKQPVHDSIQNAQGWLWLQHYIMGDTITGIAKKHNRHPLTVAKYIRRAANQMVEAAHETVMQDLFPLAIQVYKAKLELQLKKLQKGEDVDIAEVERVLKGMYVFDSPQLAEPQPPPDDGPPDTLAGYLVARTEPKLLPKGKKDADIQE